MDQNPCFQTKYSSSPDFPDIDLVQHRHYELNERDYASVTAVNFPEFECEQVLHVQTFVGKGELVTVTDRVTAVLLVQQTALLPASYEVVTQHYQSVVIEYCVATRDFRETDVQQDVFLSGRLISLDSRLQASAEIDQSCVATGGEGCSCMRHFRHCCPFEAAEVKALAFPDFGKGVALVVIHSPEEVHSLGAWVEDHAWLVSLDQGPRKGDTPTVVEQLQTVSRLTVLVQTQQDLSDSQRNQCEGGTLQVVEGHLTHYLATGRRVDPDELGGLHQEQRELLGCVRGYFSDNVLAETTAQDPYQSNQLIGEVRHWTELRFGLRQRRVP